MRGSGWLKSPRVRRVAITVGGVAVAAVAFAVVLPSIADYGAVWEVLKGLSWEHGLLLVAVTAANIVTFAPPFMVALPGLGFVRALVATQSSTASTYLAPGGAAVGMALAYGMLRAWNFAGAAVTLAVTVTGVWNQFVLLGTPAVAFGLLVATGNSPAALASVAAIGLVIFVIALGAAAAAFSSPRLADAVGNGVARAVNWMLRKLRRGSVRFSGATLVDFRVRALGLLRRRWWLLTLATLAGHLTVFAVMLASLRTLGVPSSEVSLVEAFAAWSVARLLGSIPITPGGLGIVEVGLTGLLVGFGGVRAEIVAAVLLYRFLTIVPTLVLGAIALATWRRLRVPEEEAAPS